MKDNKLVLILEKSSENLEVTRDGDEVVLSGVFAQFGVLNNNERMYEENEYLPHLEYLNKKIGKRNLLGELDHPDKFDISLSRVSHVIEHLEYNKEKRQIIGKVRLLDTPSGKIAKELVESGVPISISSRAAGLVESTKKVKIRKIFTYDLVADPGFENAVLSKMNESLGILNENVAIYDVTSQYPEMLESFEEKETVPTVETKTKDMEYVTSEELNTYSLVLKEEIENIHKKLESISENELLSSKLKELNEAFSKMQSYVNYLAITIGNGIKYSEAIAEKLDDAIEYTDYVGKTLDESINWSEHTFVEQEQEFKDKIAETIDYTEYLKNCLEESVSYAEYVARKTDKSIQYAEYVAENSTMDIDSIKEHLNIATKYANYLGDTINKGISYSEYVGEQTQQLAEYTEFMLNENTEIKLAKEKKSIDYSSITDKVDSLIESIKKQKIDNVDNSLTTNLANALGVRKIDENLLEAQKQEALEAQKNKDEKWLNEAPAEYKSIWESLDASVKNSINAQSKFYNLETAYQIKNFWETRKLNVTKTPILNESKDEPKMPVIGYGTEYLEKIKAGLDKFSKK